MESWKTLFHPGSRKFSQLPLCRKNIQQLLARAYKHHDVAWVPSVDFLSTLHLQGGHVKSSSVNILGAHTHTSLHTHLQIPSISSFHEYFCEWNLTAENIHKKKTEVVIVIVWVNSLMLKQTLTSTVQLFAPRSSEFIGVLFAHGLLNLAHKSPSRNSRLIQNSKPNYFSSDIRLFH